MESFTHTKTKHFEKSNSIKHPYFAKVRKTVTVFSSVAREIRLRWNQISCVEPALLYEDLWDTQDIE